MFYNAAEAEFEIKRLQDCCQSYRAEIERLRAALEKFAEYHPTMTVVESIWSSGYIAGVDECADLVRDMARAALAETNPAIPSREGDGGADIADRFAAKGQELRERYGAMEDVAPLLWDLTVWLRQELTRAAGR